MPGNDGEGTIGLRAALVFTKKPTKLKYGRGGQRVKMCYRRLPSESLAQYTAKVRNEAVKRERRF